MLLVRLATLFSVGRAPRAPGTWGTVVSLPLCFLLMKLGSLVYMTATIAFIALAIVAAEQYERHSQQHDAKEVVIDETVGILVTMTWLPMTWQSFAAGFLVFRFLDIWKPFPIRYFDKKVPGGFGVVADDLVAGIIGNIFLQFVLYHTSWLGVQIQNYG